MSNPVGFVLRLCYGCYVWATFVLLGLCTLLLLLIVPGIHNRRRLAQWSARCVLHATAIRFELINPHLLPGEPCVVVANHCSYLDGLLMKAALPARFSFVIKKEMVKVPLAGLLLKRIGSLFVDRANRHASGMDARRIMREAVDGKSLVFFPEGTFTTRVGLQGFHLGAFATAQRAALPVVPVVIHGTRRILRPGSPWPRPGLVEVEILGMLAQGTVKRDRSQTELLRDQARARILMALGEPDLLAEAEVPDHNVDASAVD